MESTLLEDILPENIPVTYLETAEFDCLHDEGLLYAERLKNAGVQVLINETRATMHGFNTGSYTHLEEKAAAYKYIFEYVPNLYSVNDQNLKEADAIEIKIGQGTKPGMGGHLPGEKVTAEIAAVRGKEQGKDVQSPSKFPNINSKEDLKDLVSQLRKRSEGRPIGKMCIRDSVCSMCRNGIWFLFLR